MLFLCTLIDRCDELNAVPVPVPRIRGTGGFDVTFTRSVAKQPYRHVAIVTSCSEKFSLLSAAGRAYLECNAEWRPGATNWDDDMSASCTAGPVVRQRAGIGWPYNALRYSISSCQSATKALPACWSCHHLSCAVVKHPDICLCVLIVIFIRRKMQQTIQNERKSYILTKRTKLM